MPYRYHTVPHVEARIREAIKGVDDETVGLALKRLGYEKPGAITAQDRWTDQYWASRQQQDAAMRNMTVSNERPLFGDIFSGLFGR